MPEPTAVATRPATTTGTTIATTADATTADATTANSADVWDLIEDVSIDGMCGVY